MDDGGNQITLAAGYLPEEELMTDIFSKLPVKSLLRFSCVHSTWNYLFKSPSFIARYLENSTNTRYGFISLCKNHSDRTKHFKLFHSVTSDTFDVCFEHKLPFQDHNWNFKAIDSCNGLICYDVGSSKEIVFYNPFTNEHKTITFSDDNYDYYYKLEALGFGYDPVNNCYKIIRIVTFGLITNRPVSKAEVYTLGISNSSSWRNLELPDGVTFLSSLNCSVYQIGAVHLNGAIHWLRNCNNPNNPHIIRFDVSHEVFHLLPLPEECVSLEFPDQDLRISVYCGLLSVIKPTYFNEPNSYGYEIWATEKYGAAAVEESWFKLRVVKFSSNGFPHLLGLGMNRELILQIKKEIVVYFDSESEDFIKKKIIKCHDDHNNASFLNLVTCKESLLSPAEILNDYQKN